MRSWTSKMWIRANGLPLFTTPSSEKGKEREGRRQRPAAPRLLHASVILVCLASSIIPQCEGFFFPKSFFRKGNESPPPPPQQQHHQQQPHQHPRLLPPGGGGNPIPHNHNVYGQDHFQGAGTNVQTRIVNRPPYQNQQKNNAIDQNQQASGPVPGSGFHVPRELCLACEKFPWMPVAGAGPVIGSASTANAQSQQPQEQPRQPSYISGQSSTPTKTIVINALGEAQGPVPVPPQIPSRRPFAIQFDGGHSGNQVNYQEPPKQGPPPQQPPPQQYAPVGQSNQGPQSKPQQERPVSFQIFQAQTNQPQQQPTLLHQQQQQQHQQQHPIGLHPPPVPQSYGQPTVLIPVNSQSAQVGAHLSVQGNQGSAPPPNPLTVGTIIASQHGNAPVPQFQKIEQAKLVYQEHFTAAPPPSPQNFKVPILNHPKPIGDNKIPHENSASNNIVPPQFSPPINYGPPQRPGQLFLQMRPPALYQHGPPPPRPSLNMKPPGPMIHYGKPVHIPNNIGPQRPSGQVVFPPPQAFLQMAPPPPPHQGQSPNIAYGAPRPDSSNSLESSVRPQDERRPAPSSQVFNTQPPHPTQTNRPPTPAHNVLNTNSIQPVPIPIPTVQTNQQETGKNIHSGNRPNKAESTFTQETGWEIIPSIQTDLTHLFSQEKGKQSAQGAKELPVPVPIPVPQSHPPKSPFFIVAGAGQQQQQQQQQQPQEQIKVQDVTYHEESRNPVPTVSVPLNTINENVPQQSNEQQQQQQQQQQFQQQQINSGPTNENLQNLEQERRPQVQPAPQPFIRSRPIILGYPTGATRPVIFRPHPNQQQNFQQLHPSIMTALNHAQQTSLLTHQYFRQPSVAQQIRENTIYVSPVVNTGTGNNVQQVQQLQTNNVPLSESASNSVHQEAHEANKLEEQQPQLNHGIDPRIPTSPEQNPNCNKQQQQQQQQQPWLIPITTHQREQQQQQNQEVEQDASAVDQSISTGQDDQSQTYGRDNENDVSSSPTFSPSPEPTYTTTSLVSPIPTSATTQFTSSPGIRGSIQVQDNGNKGSYLIYYPRPVSKSPVYWVQPSRTSSQGVVRLSPQVSPVAPSVASTVVSWSRPRVVVANQFRTPQQPQEEQQGRYEDPTNSEEVRGQASYERGESTNESEEQAQSGQVSVEQQQQHDDDDIPFGQKLGVSRDSNRVQKPYDIISVGGSDDEAQSIEETPVSSDHSQSLTGASEEQGGKEQFGENEYSPSGQDGGSTGIGNDNVGANNGHEQETLQNENNLQSVQQETKSTNQDENEDADDERDDFGYRPQTIFRKPISTTVIHSPGASSFQSLKLPNFKPHRVIVHDFTTHSANAAATGPSAQASETQESVEGSKGQQTFSPETTSGAWTASQKLKAPKLVESNDDEEESSESIHRPQGFNIQEVIASGPVSNADCLTTAHSGHLLTSLASTSPRTAESSVTSAKGRDIFLPLGSRFPAGRPSIFSALRRPVSVPTTTATTSTTTATTTTTSAPSTTSESTQEAFSPSTNKRERFLGQSPSGFAASIAVPVYRRPIGSNNHVGRDPLGREESSSSGIGSGNGNGIDSSVTYIKPQANVILTTEDIYKPSEERVADNVSSNDPIKLVESSTSVSTSSSSAVSDNEMIESVDEIMSTEKSSSFSVSSVVDEKRGGFSNNRDERGFSTVSFGNNDISQQVGSRPHGKVNVVQVNSVPVITEAEPITTTSSSSFADSLTSTTAPAPASTSTKIVKTVRVRQRMRSGSHNGPLRTRFHGGGRVRVVHRPANQEYIRHFPEFATQEGDKLAKEEEQEVKNALIELKKSTEPVKTH